MRDPINSLIVVACLFACQGSYGKPVTSAICYLALLAFIISIPLFGRFDLPQRPVAGLAPFSGLESVYLDVLLRWGAVVAALLFLMFVFKVGAAFSRNVMLTWFVTTPFALCLWQTVRLRGGWREARRVGALIGTALLFVWLVGVIWPAPPSVYGGSLHAVYCCSHKEPRHHPEGAVHIGPRIDPDDWVLTVVRDGRDLRLSNFPTHERCEERLKDLQSYDPAVMRGGCSSRYR